MMLLRTQLDSTYIMFYTFTLYNMHNIFSYRRQNIFILTPIALLCTCDNKMIKYLSPLSTCVFSLFVNNYTMFVFRTEYYVVLMTCTTAITVLLPEQQTIQQAKTWTLICLLFSLIIFQSKTPVVSLPLQNYNQIFLNEVFGTGDKHLWLTTTEVVIGILSILLMLNIVLITITILTKKTGGGGKQDDGKGEGLRIRIAVGTKLVVLVVKNILIVIILSIVMALIVKMKTIILIIIITMITTTIELL